MHVLIADPFQDTGLKGLAELGCRVSHEPGVKGPALVEAVARLQPDVLVVRSTKAPAEVLGAAPLKLVIRAGSGYDNIDIAAAVRLGIPVANCPRMNSVAVAELAFAFIAAMDRRLPENLDALRAGQWRKGEFAKAHGLFGRTLGIVGVGSIGSELVHRARAFGMHVVGWSRSLTPMKAADLGLLRLGSPEEVAAASDVVSLHMVLADDTRGRIGKPFFEAMRPGALLVNTARAELLDVAALKDAIETKGVRLAMDVWPDEPPGTEGEFHSDLIGLPGVYGTAHIGASTEQAQDAVAAETVRIVRELMADRPIPNLVNPQ